ncbi:ribosome small subunit-dependent GTPase A [Oricola sp.]|uniref:ribosome small subunit-dependent GTPase A n=1 Tax=Oricola sp. TaxID=1979950 RepID=UPI0025DC2A95|nr:ribosome small subunit-dependent GTPase A [Oricola sp.]MCI5075802.1 ribosome small subunit-dependent GTPase A [Oricola sp.]
MTINPSQLADYGWNSHFTSQLDADDFGTFTAARVTAVHRSGLHIAGVGIDAAIPPFSSDDEEGAATVGDWLLLEPETLRARHLLDRKSLFKRRAAGTGRKLQLIAANVDTLFIVTSCNQDFNVARLERYLALAREAGVMPVVVLTKADLTDTPEDFEREAAGLAPGLFVEIVDARDPASVARLAAWCGKGETVALVGSSGVGKSTLINTLAGSDEIATGGIREDDAKGRHTTTGRMLHRLASGGWLIDTPGMREIQLVDVHAGIDEVFSDVVEIAGGCRFRDCRHEDEPGCAVNAAIADGTLDPDRVRRWKKLAAEEAYNSASLAERRARDKAFGKMVKTVMKEKTAKKGG